MVEIVPGELLSQSQPALRRWRQLLYLLTVDIAEREQLLSLVAEQLCAAECAAGCVLTYTAPVGPPLTVAHGLVTPIAEQTIAQVMANLPARQRLLHSEEYAGTRVLTLPLTHKRDTVGYLHLIDADPTLAPDELQTIAVMLSNALRRQLVTAEAQHLYRHTVERYHTVQQAVTRVLADSTSIGAATPLILQSFCEGLGWDLGVHWSLDPASEELRGNTSWYARDMGVNDFGTFCVETSFRRGVGLPGRVWATGAPIWIVDVLQDLDFPGAHLAAREHLHNAFCFPILSDHQIVGVIALFRRDVHGPDTALIELMTMYGSQIGQFIDGLVTERALKETDQKYRSVVEQVREVIFQTDAAGSWTFLNGAWTELTGCAVADSLGTSIVGYVHPDAQQPDRERLRDLLARRGTHTRYETRFLTRAGAVRWVEVSVWPAYDTDGSLIGTSGTLTDISARKQTEAENAELTAALRIERDRLLRREVEVRTQIGRDLHDGPVQQVAVAEVNVQYVRKVAAHAPEKLDEALDDLREQLRRTTKDLRTVLYELRPLGIAEEGLRLVLQQYIGQIHDRNGLRIHLDVPADIPRLGPDVDGAVFIIMQEALNNCRKHAKARDVWLRVRVADDAVVAQVEDNGRGFPVEQVQASYVQRGSFGLLNMVERAQLLGGTCTIRSRAGGGTTVEVRVPRGERHAEPAAGG